MKQTPSPNHGGKFTQPPRFIVVHNTAGGSASSSVSWLCNKKSKASAHLLIGREGEIYQLVPFDTVSWANGESRYGGFAGLNKSSITIELANAGPLLKYSAESYKNPLGVAVDALRVYKSKHKNGGSFEYWEAYTAEQIGSLLLAISDLKRDFSSLEEVVGHDDISGFRGKIDPGPALAPWLSLPYKL